MSLHDEVREQPDVLQRLLDGQGEVADRIARLLTGKPIDYVFVAARGSSDFAALYAKYLWGAVNRLPVALAGPSLFSLYRTPPRLERALVLGISQSGESPDIVSVLEEARRQGRPTVAITNTGSSPLARAADVVLELGAGHELAVAATKTYTAQLMAIAMVSAALRGQAERGAALAAVPAAVARALELEETIGRAIARYRYMNHCVVLGRGFNYATAFELALKLKELTYVVAEPYSPADFQHGPVAVVDHGFPVLGVAAKGPVLDELTRLLSRLKEERGAELIVIADTAQALGLAETPLPLPSGLPEWLTPLTAVIPGQLFAYHLAKAKGFDPENPRGLGKITRTT